MSASLMSLSDWFGLAAVVAVVIAGYLAGVYGSRKAGQQKIAEARLDWNARYNDRALKLYALMTEVNRLQGRRSSIRRARLMSEARQAGLEIMMMINPDGAGAAAFDEYNMERDLLTRLANLGIDIDMTFVRHHRAVLKHAWRQAKNEF